MTIMTKETDMTREQALDVLNGAFSQRYNSVAQYLIESHPHVRAGEEPLLRCIEEIAASDRAFADRIAEAIEALEGIPQVVPYAHDVAELNYLALGYSCRILINTLREEIVLYTGRLAGLQSYGPAVEVMCALVKFLEQHIARLTELVAA